MAPEENAQNDPNLEITVQSSRGTKTFTFPKTTKVADAIQAIVDEFGFASGDRFELVLASDPSQPLQPERPLVSYEIADGTTLILTSIGAGV